MSKRVTLDDEELYVLARLIQDQLNKDIVSSEWVYKKFASTRMQALLNKLAPSKA